MKHACEKRMSYTQQRQEAIKLMKTKLARSILKNQLMMGFLSCCNYLFIVILCVAVVPAVNGNNCHYNKQYSKKQLFVFGDSLFDPGNNQFLGGSGKDVAASWPYGIDLHNHSTGRFSNGLLVPDFIALFAKLKPVPPVLEPGACFDDGASFASAGSGVLEIHSGAMNLKIQLSNFKKVVKSIKQKIGVEETKKILKGSVFLFSIGGNDYMSLSTDYPNATQSQITAFRRMVVGNITHALKEIYDMGGRKVAFQNVGPIGCLPGTKQIESITNGSCATSFSLVAQQHNKALANALAKLEENLPGFKYSIFDYYNSLDDRINHPEKYGFKVGEIACCGDGLYNGKNCGGGSNGTLAYNLCRNRNEFVFFDGEHTTQKANLQLAELIWSGLPNITAPYNVKQLFQSEY